MLSMNQSIIGNDSGLSAIHLILRLKTKSYIKKLNESKYQIHISTPVIPINT